MFLYCPLCVIQWNVLGHASTPRCGSSPTVRGLSASHIQDVADGLVEPKLMTMCCVYLRSAWARGGMRPLWFSFYQAISNTLKMGGQSQNFRRTFTSWHGCLPENVSSNNLWPRKLRDLNVLFCLKKRTVIFLWVWTFVSVIRFEMKKSYIYPQNVCFVPFPQQNRFFTIQMYQPIRCNNFSSLLLDVYVQLNIFRASSRPSSGAQQLQ